MYTVRREAPRPHHPSHTLREQAPRTSSLVGLREVMWPFSVIEIPPASAPDTAVHCGDHDVVEGLFEVADAAPG
jgi:hypothetical protein